MSTLTAIIISVATTLFSLSPNNGVDRTNDLRTILSSCKETEGQKTVIFAPGRYDFYVENSTKKEIFVSNTSSEKEEPDKTKNIGIWIDGISDLTMKGEGATLVFHGDMTPIAINGSSNIRLEGFEIDFLRPGGSEITFVAQDAEGTVCRLHEDSWYEIRDKQIYLVGEGWTSKVFHCIKYNPEDGHFTYSGDWNILNRSEATEISKGLVRFRTPEDFKAQIGATLTVRDRIRRQVGTLIHYSKDITLAGMHYRYMHGLGVISQYTDGVNILGCEFAASKESGRILASSADFLHFSGCSGHIEVRDSYFCGAQDDCINVHGTNLKTIQTEGRDKIRVRFMHHQSYGFRAYSPGDTVAFVHPDAMVRYSKAVVKDVQRLDDYESIVTLDRKLPKGLRAGADCLENLSCTPSLHVSGCTFTRTSTRGILCTTPRKVVIENNRFFKTGMSGVLIESDAKEWFESGPVTDVTIRNNSFEDCAFNGGPDHAMIGINPSNTLVGKKYPVHRNIRIEGNSFILNGSPALSAKSVRGLVFKGNKIDGPRERTVILYGCSATEISE